MRIDSVTANLPADGKANVQDVKLRKACQDFESMLVAQLLSKLRDTVPKTDLFGSSEEEKLFRGMLDQEIAKEVSRTGSMGLAKLLYDQVSGGQKIR
jgi:peptidoglycan hydrolase FlgJ